MALVSNEVIIQADVKPPLQIKMSKVRVFLYFNIIILSFCLFFTKGADHTKTLLATIGQKM